MGLLARPSRGLSDDTPGALAPVKSQAVRSTVAALRRGLDRAGAPGRMSNQPGPVENPVTSSRMRKGLQAENPRPVRLGTRRGKLVL